MPEIENDDELKSLLGEKLYIELSEIRNRNANVDMCNIGKPIDTVEGLVGCHKTTRNKKELEAERDKFIKSLEERFIPKENLEENALKMNEFNKCKKKMSDIMSDMEKKITESYTKYEQSHQLYFVLHRLLALHSVITVHDILNGNDKFDIDKYERHDILNREDYYWSKIKRLKDYYKEDGIRDYEFHNYANYHYKNFLSKRKLHKDIRNLSFDKPIIEMYQTSMNMTEAEINKNKSRMTIFMKEKSESYYNNLALIFTEIENKINANHQKILLAIASDPLMTTNATGNVESNFKKMFDGVGDIIKKHVNTKERFLANIEPLDSISFSIDKVKSSVDLKDEILRLFDIFQNDLELYYMSIDMYDDNDIKSKVSKNFSKLKCMQNGLGDDEMEKKLKEAIAEAEKLLENGIEADDGEYVENGKGISTDPETYDLLSPKYWIKYTMFLNLVSLLPMHWTIGIIIPPAIKIPLPIIYIFITVFYIPPLITVIWLTINGMVIVPVILTIDFSSGKALTNWLLLFRGANQQVKDNGGCKVAFTGGVKPQVVSSEDKSKVTLVDTLVDITKMLPLVTDDYPPFKRLSLSNPVWLLFLNGLCLKAKPKMGFP